MLLAYQANLLHSIIMMWESPVGIAAGKNPAWLTYAASSNSAVCPKTDIALFGYINNMTLIKLNG